MLRPPSPVSALSLRWALLSGLLVGLIGTLTGCEGPVDAGSDPLRLPPGFPRPVLAEPLTAERVELGRLLFYDKRLSDNRTQSCATCHRQELAFTDGRARAEGSTGQLHPRSAMALANVAYAAALTWANPLSRTLEEQALVPLFGDNPVELGLAGREADLLLRLSSDERYRGLFGAAFPDQGEPVNLHNLTLAIAAFERTLISGRSPYDRLVYSGQSDALSDSARRGMDLFFSERLECFHCHGGFNFQDATVYEGMPTRLTVFHNTGLYNVGGDGSYPQGNQGVFEISHRPRDRGRFRAPSLRNIALTAPYMHDGSIATLSQVVTDHYMRGGRLTSEGQNAGDGALNPEKSVLVRPFSLSADELADLLSFLGSLTDDEFIKDPRHADPFVQAP